METWRSEVRLGQVGGNDCGSGCKADHAARTTGIECVRACVCLRARLVSGFGSSQIINALL